MVQKKVQKYAFKLLIEMKQKCNKKMSNLSYEKHEIQPYMISNRFNLREIKLLFSLRSKCFPAKMNFTKLNRGNLRCSFLCDSYETQDHIFENCNPIRQRIGYPHMVNLKLIYGSIDEQYSIIKILTRINNERILMKQDVLPGGFSARTPVDT